MPSSVRDRFTVDFEYVYFFVKARKYWFEQQREPNTIGSKERLKYTFNPKTEQNSKYKNGNENKTLMGAWSLNGKNKRTVWTIPQKPWSTRSLKGGPQEVNNPRANFSDKTLPGHNKRAVWKIPTHANPEAHFATFPPKLVRPMIKAGCPEFICSECGKPREKIFNRESIPTRPGLKTKYEPILGTQISKNLRYRLMPKIEIKGYTDCGCNAKFTPGVVLDPFTGTGTTLYQAWKLGRNYIGFEISKEYCEIAQKQLLKTQYRRIDSFI
jgi:hypothetical protein